MANADTPFGLKWIGSTLGGSVNPSVVACYTVAGYGTALFVGDPVVVVAAGSNAAREERIGGSFEIGTMPIVERATVTDTGLFSGVVVGVAPTNQDSPTYSPASTEGVVYVCMDPFAEYMIQADGAVPAASVGLNAVGIDTHAGNTTTGLSGMELYTTSDAPAIDGSNTLTIIRLVNAPDNETNAIHNKVIVRINQSTAVTLAVDGL